MNQAPIYTNGKFRLIPAGKDWEDVFTIEKWTSHFGWQRIEYINGSLEKAKEYVDHLDEVDQLSGRVS